MIKQAQNMSKDMKGSSPGSTSQEEQDARACQMSSDMASEDLDHDHQGSKPSSELSSLLCHQQWFWLATGSSHE